MSCGPDLVFIDVCYAIRFRGHRRRITIRDALRLFTRAHQPQRLRHPFGIAAGIGIAPARLKMRRRERKPARCHPESIGAARSPGHRLRGMK